MSAHEVSAEQTAVLVIDLQREFVGSEAIFPVPGAERIVERSNAVLKQFRDAGTTVIFTAFAVPRPQPLGRSTTRFGRTDAHRYPLAGLVDVIAIGPDDIVIEKSRQSAFVGTNLEMILRRKGIDRVVIMGVTTHSCCLATAIDAAARDFDVVLLSDLTASTAIRGSDGEITMTAQQSHDAALQFISYSAGRVALTFEFLAELTGKKAT